MLTKIGYYMNYKVC